MRRIAVVIFIMILACVVADAQSYIRRGKDVYSAPLYNWDGSCLRAGNSKYSEVLINFDGEYIRGGGSRYGEILYNWNGVELRGGRGKYAKVLFSWDGKTSAKATADIPPRCTILTANTFARVRINIHSH